MKSESSWLVVLGADGRILEVDGGAPTRWVGVRLEQGTDVPTAIVGAAREVLARLASPQHLAGVAHVVLRPEDALPAVTIVAMEGVLLWPVETDVEALLKQTLAPLVRQAATVGVRITIEHKGAVPHDVLLDGDKIAWAIATLVGNALRYLGERAPGQAGEIDVVVSHDEAASCLTITVHDNGPGIAASVRPWLFEKHPYTGRPVGVALPMIRDIAAAHGGSVVLLDVDRRYKAGTSVALCLPSRRGQHGPTRGT